MRKGKPKNKKGNACCGDLRKLMEPRFFKALCDPNRIALLARLAQCKEPCTVSEMSKCCPINISVVSRHLSQMKDAGLLEAQKKGKEVYYSVRFPEVVNTIRSIANAIEACCSSQKKEATHA